MVLSVDVKVVMTLHNPFGPLVGLEKDVVDAGTKLLVKILPFMKESNIVSKLWAYQTDMESQSLHDCYV